ncbi:MAG TPA: hypothetical protein VGZ25_07380 [Gemmataceae bacterium]|jgi:hypothetical protein|nr:hypothetical protein [Gemmataceae bacterium]
MVLTTSQFLTLRMSGKNALGDLKTIPDGIVPAWTSSDPSFVALVPAHEKKYGEHGPSHSCYVIATGKDPGPSGVHNTISGSITLPDGTVIQETFDLDIQNGDVKAVELTVSTEPRDKSMLPIAGAEVTLAHPTVH